jgi:NAD(P)-dependent dehydrogenase (short-subunit alcohol dehydrogenase family)
MDMICSGRTFFDDKWRRILGTFNLKNPSFRKVYRNWNHNFKKRSKKMTNTSTPTALVTGISGIGAGYIKICLEKGLRVFAVDRKQSALDDLPTDPNLVKILADVGTKEGLTKVGEVVGDEPLNYILLAAAVAPNDGTGKAAPNMGLSNLTYDLVDDAIRTDVHGKVFLVKELLSNLIAGFESSGKKSRVMNIGAPFGDGPKPDGSWMVIPGWMTMGVSKAASKYVWESLKMELKFTPGGKEAILLGYGHPGLTESSITKEAARDYPDSHPLKGMVNARMSSGAYHTRDESAALFNGVFEQTTDEEFEAENWTVVKMYGSNFEGVEVKETPDVSAGIVLPGKS